MRPIADLSTQVDGVKADVAEVKTRLDRIATSARPALSVDGVKGTVDPARRAFVNGYLRTGRDAEIKSLSGVTPADGGFAVPREIDAMITRMMKKYLSHPVHRHGRPNGQRGLPQIGIAKRRGVRLGRGNGGSSHHRHADLCRNRAANGGALRQSGGVSADAGRCRVRCGKLAGR